MNDDRLPSGVPGDVTLVQVLSELARSGYDHDVLVDPDDGWLTCAVCRVRTSPPDAKVDSLRRVEGASDPADMAAVLAMTCGFCGSRGTAILRFGPEASPGEAAVLVAMGGGGLPVSPSRGAMPTEPLLRGGVAAIAVRIGQLLSEHGEQMAVAESLTGGLLASVLAATEDASEWFRGSVTAYQPLTKQRVLGVPPGPVVTEAAALAMAEGVASLLEADLAVAVTGVGGPGPEEGQPAGTVWLAIRYRSDTATQRLQLEGEPEEICVQTCVAALREAVAVLAHHERATRGQRGLECPSS